MPLDDGVCEVWPLDTNVCPIEGVPEPKLTWAQRAASDYLWALTGRRFGPSCPFTVRPCRKSCADGYGITDRFFNQGQYRSTGGWIPYLGADGFFRNASLCGCTGPTCHCGPEVCEVELAGPIYDIVQVDVDGVVQDESTYTIRDGRFLMRINNHAVPDLCWPTCQDMGKPSGTTDTFSVTYRTGIQVPFLGTMAMTALVKHLISECDGCGCGTAARNALRSVNRQGVELEFVDPSELFKDGLTGIPAVDRFLAAYGGGPRSPMRVLSPDRRMPQVRSLP